MRDSLTKIQQGKIQSLRGLAIIAVVIAHSTPSGLAQVYCRPFLNFSVGLFLFFSGMLSDITSWHPAKRIKKVLIPYVIWTLIYTVFWHYHTPSEIPSVFIKDLITSNSAGMMYYIFVYIQCTLLIPLIDKLARSQFWYLGFLISPIEIILFRIIPFVTGNELNNYFQLIMNISCLGLFSLYYLGYMLGNSLFPIRISDKKLLVYWMLSTCLQIAEGYLYFKLGSDNCGTQFKLTAILTSALFAVLSFRYITSDQVFRTGILEWVGNLSFGIFFSHMLIINILRSLPCYVNIVHFPVNAFFAVTVSCMFVVTGRRILGRYGKYFAF